MATLQHIGTTENISSHPTAKRPVRRIQKLFEDHQAICYTDKILLLMVKVLCMYFSPVCSVTLTMHVVTLPSVAAVA